jgi:hypothetical protein
LSQPLPHLVGHHLRHSNVLMRISRPSCEPLYETYFHHNQETFLYESFALSPFAHKRLTTECCSLGIHSSSTVSIFTTETSL